MFLKAFTNVKASYMFDIQIINIIRLIFILNLLKDFSINKLFMFTPFR